MKKLLKYCYFILIVILFTGCGTTKIILDNKNINASIYVNGVYKGKNTAEIQRTGTPKKIHVEAKYRGQTIGTIDERRKFKFSTFVFGYITYGIGLVTCWRFPEYIIIPTDNVDSDIKSLWDETPNNEWTNPSNK